MEPVDESLIFHFVDQTEQSQEQWEPSYVQAQLKVRDNQTRPKCIEVDGSTFSLNTNPRTVPNTSLYSPFEAHTFLTY